MASNVFEFLFRRFPQYASRIERFAHQDARFRHICEDHAEAQQAMETMRSKDADRQWVEDYRRLVGELEDEIFAILEAGTKS